MHQTQTSKKVKSIATNQVIQTWLTLVSIFITYFAKDFILDNCEVDEQFLHKFEILSVLKGDFGPIDQYMDEIAYKNLDYKLS